MSNLLIYAGFLHRFVLHPKGYVEIEKFRYDSSTERFSKVKEKIFVDSSTLKSNSLKFLSALPIEQNLRIIFNLKTSENSILFVFQYEPKCSSTKILQTFAVPSSIDGQIEILSQNIFSSFFITDQIVSKGFYRLNHRDAPANVVEFFSCRFEKFFTFFSNVETFWFIGREIEKKIRFSYFCERFSTKNFLLFDTFDLIPSNFKENIENLHLIEYQIQLKSQKVIGDVLIATTDRRLVFSRRGQIFNEISTENLSTKIFFYENFDEKKFFICFNEKQRSAEIFQFENQILTPHIDRNETAEAIFIDDFTQIGSKQILFLKNSLDFDDFLLTDLSTFADEENQLDALEKNPDEQIQQSLAIARQILREKILAAEFLVDDGRIQRRQIENEIRRIENENLLQSNDVEILDKNWFIDQKTLFVFVTLKTRKSSFFPLIVDRRGNEVKSSRLKTILNDDGISSTLILTTNFNFDRDFHVDLFLVEIETKKIFHCNSIDLKIDELIEPKNDRILQLDESNRTAIFFSTFFRIEISLRTESKFELIERFRRFLTKIGFQSFRFASDGFFRLNDRNLFGDVFVRLVDSVDPLRIEFFAARNVEEAARLCRYVLSKIDIDSFSLSSSTTEIDRNKFVEKIQHELDFYVDLFKQIPTVMRKISPTSKSEAYRLFKSTNFHQFQNEHRQTDWFIGSTIID